MKARDKLLNKFGEKLHFTVHEKLTFMTASANSMESDLECTSIVYFDNVTLTSQKPYQHNNTFDCS